MVEYNIDNLVSIDAIFDFFSKSNYKIEDDKAFFPLSKLLEKPIEGDVWLIVEQTDLMVLVIKADAYNQMTYRTKAINYLKELAGMKLVFFTKDFDYYHLTLIHDGIFSIKFKPSDPEMIAIRVFEALESGEDLFDFTRQDINFILLKRELTANALKESIKTGDDSLVKISFQDGGLKLIGEGSEKIVVAHKDAPIKDLIVDVNLKYDKSEIDKYQIDIVQKTYKKFVGNELKLYALITTSGIIYHWIPYSISGFIGYKNLINEDVMDEVLESLIAQANDRTAFNSDTFHQQFGTYSPFFVLGWNSYKYFFEQELEKIKIMYEEWKSRFSKVYQLGDLDQELFIKHAYLALLIKTVLISKFAGKNDKDQKIELQKIVDIFEERGVPIFLNDFFQWASEEKVVQSEIFEALHNADFIIDDLFRTIYQEMVSPATRHALGEFYTPAPLAEKMVEDVYKFGQYVLDPACGSGTFLVEILNFINNSNKKDEEKIEALSKLYGFDVNPIAVLVARANLLLLTDKLFGINTKIPINVYLADSLNPINEFISDIDKSKLFKKVKKDRIQQVTKITSIEGWGASAFGEIERFNMPAINDSLVINVKFFKYTEQFGAILKELDRFLSKDVTFDDMLKKIYLSIDIIWLEELCEGSSTKTLRNNFEYLAKKLYDFVKKDKNHIWAYLLYNAIGVRKMKETMDGVDLIIGNPPWLTISAILSQNYKDLVKKYSEDLGIYVGKEQAPHTELCSIFFFKSCNLYLRKNGIIFFVTTAGIETTDQHSKFRLFNGFKEVFIWKFFKDVFRIHNICIGAIYSDQPLKERVKVDVKTFEVNKKTKTWEFELKNKDIYVPYNYNTIETDLIAKRLIPISELDKMLPSKESFYKKKFRNGATIVPRSFFFIKILKDGTIIPDKSILTKEPWDFYPIEKYDIEKEYIFSVCKSTTLVPFKLLSHHQCFLPIEKSDNTFHEDLIKPKAKKVFNILSQKYREIQERDQRVITNLLENINHINKLSNPLQRSNLKVIYNSTGSILKSAIIEGEIIVDSKFFYMGEFNSKKEAMYICTILNAPCLTKQLKKTGGLGASGSVREIHLRALNFPIPKFNEKNEIHINIIDLGKKLEEDIHNLIDNRMNQEIINLKKKIQCKHCGKLYNNKNFERCREKHESMCEKIKDNYEWSNDDWIDLKDIALEDVKLSKMSLQTVIYKDPHLKDKFDELDKLVIQLLNSEVEND